jgi:hypothetical protein
MAARAPESSALASPGHPIQIASSPCAIRRSPVASPPTLGFTTGTPSCTEIVTGNLLATVMSRVMG